MILENLKEYQIINPEKILGGNTTSASIFDGELFTNGSRQFPTP